MKSISVGYLVLDTLYSSTLTLPTILAGTLKTSYKSDLVPMGTVLCVKLHVTYPLIKRIQFKDAI